MNQIAVFTTSNIFLLSIMLIQPAQPHGGGLDASGCHNNRKTGDRHCHRNGGRPSVKKTGLVSGPVTLLSVGDGDTVRVTDRSGAKFTIRLACIDAPETSQGESGKWSTETLRGLIRGNSLFLKPQVIDPYGRTVAEIYQGLTNINLEMVKLGAGFAYRRYLKQCDSDIYLKAETTAMNRKVGVWGPYKVDIKPWDYRRLRRR